MLYAAAAVERAMKIQQVIVRALSGAITWLQAADILDLDPRSMRRWRARYEAGGPVALYDRRRVRPSDQYSAHFLPGRVPILVENRNGAFFRLMKCTTSRPPWQ